MKQGELVEFVLQSDDTDHGFKISSAAIDVAIPPVERVKFASASSHGEGNVSI